MRGDQRHRAGLLATVCLSAVLAGCASPAGPAGSVGPAAPAAPKAAPAEANAVPAAPAEANAAPAAPADASEVGAAEDADRAALETAQRWGLDQVPLKAPPRPASKVELTPVQGVKLADGRPPVVFRVPTDDNVVFLTVDDGAEKDPEFSRMAKELGIPLSTYVSDYLARENYGYFRDLHAQGVEINNHTINHRNLKVLDYETQREEICTQQDQLEEQIGVRPRLFRPPYGEYNDDTLRAAASCGVQAVPMWNEEAFPDHMEWRYDDQKLHSGDIILTHFRGTDIWNASMPDLLRKVVNDATAQGFALARLDDYL
ncbi:polysaccharide deacetylase family protein [Kitasatospora brasiliensis]|uniref:polysaccharide deacetylase family protein n=1 Tax=Kitasatospora brasiliensis TaxID=3058040 RepID=UPI00292E4E7F|nr:polysaccharide deacetylase family protein [Kitasatospora sp. K002]